MDRFLHEEAASRTAHVALVEEDTVDDALDRLVDWRIVEHDVRGLAAELKRQLLARAGRLLGDGSTDCRRSRERDLVDAGVTDERGPCGTGAGHDVDHSARKIGLLQDFGEQQRRQRGRLGGLEHDGVARGERRGNLPRKHEEREVPGNDLARDTERTRVRAEPRVVELVGPPRVVEKPGCDERHVDVAALLDRLAVVEAFGHGKFACALLHEASDAVEVLAAITPAHL